MNDPVGLDEIPKDIPQPIYVDGIVADSISNFHLEVNTGSKSRLWIGESNSIESRILVRFAVSDSAILANADSAKVTLSLYGTWKKGVGFNVFPLTRSWDETTVGWKRSSTDSQWSNPGGDYDITKIASVVINESVVDFTFNCEEFSLLDTSLLENNGMIFVYDIGDTILSIYSKESTSNSLKLTVFYGDSTKDYSPVSDAFITNSTYIQGNNEIVMGEGYAMRALLLFKIDNTLPPNITINRALLTFAFNPDNSYFDSMTVFIYRVMGEWNEDSTDYHPYSVAFFTFHKDDTTFSETDITSLVQYWVNVGENYGLLLRAKNENSFCSRLVLDALHKPILSVYYTPPPMSGH